MESGFESEDSLSPTNSVAISAMMHVRPIVQLDRDRWRSLWDGYLRFHEADVRDEITEQAWCSFFADEGHNCLVAVDTDTDSGEIVGFATYLTHPSTWTLHGYCYLEDLFVDAAHRSCGVGRSLINAVVQIAGDADITRVYWVTDLENDTAQRLYDTVARRANIMQYRISPKQ